MRTPHQERVGCGSMDNYQGVIPFIWKRIRQYRFRDTYQQMNKEYYYPRRRRQALIKSTSLGGRRSWGLKMPKLRISAAAASPVSVIRGFKERYMRMVMTLTGRKNSSRLTYSNYSCGWPKGSSKRFEASNDYDDDLDDSSYSVGYVNYLVKARSLGAAPSYAYSSKW